MLQLRVSKFASHVNVVWAQREAVYRSGALGAKQEEVEKMQRIDEGPISLISLSKASKSVLTSSPSILLGTTTGMKPENEQSI